MRYGMRTQPLSALSGTFSHCFATGEGNSGEDCLLPSAGWEKVAEGRMRALSAREVLPC
jgi:hypothetical protein